MNKRTKQYSAFSITVFYFGSYSCVNIWRIFLFNKQNKVLFIYRQTCMQAVLYHQKNINLRERNV